MTVLEATWLIIPRLLFLRNFGFFTVFLINFGPIGRRREWLSSSSITPKSLLQCQVLDSSPGSFLIKIIYQEVYELCMKTHHRKGGRCVHTKGVILIFRSKWPIHFYFFKFYSCWLVCLEKATLFPFLWGCSKAPPLQLLWFTGAKPGMSVLVLVPLSLVSLSHDHHLLFESIFEMLTTQEDH